MPTKRISERLGNEEFGDFALGAGTPSAIDAFLSLRPRLQRPIQVRQCLVYHRGDLANVLASKFMWSGARVRLVNPSGAVFEVSLSPLRAEKRESHGYIAVLPGGQPDSHRVVTVSTTYFWRTAVRPLVRHLYPRAMPIFLRQGEIRDALVGFEGSLGAKWRLLVTEVTMKKRRADQPSPSRRLDTDRRWTELPVGEAFDDALEQGQWFTSIHFKVERQLESGTYRDVAKGCVYKRGEIVYDALHREISTHLVSVLERHGTERLEFLRMRGIRERGYKPSLPVQIRYDQDVFDDVTEVRRFARAMARYPNSTQAVFHGNPYYHASIADYVDGSSFEVWILSATRVLIVPQAKSSEQAFGRLIAHVFSEFEEGTIGEYTG